MPLWFSRKECSAVSWPLCRSIIRPLICLWRMRRPGLTNQCYGFFQNSTQSHKWPTRPLFSIRCTVCIIHAVDRWTPVSSWAYLAYRDSPVGATVMCRMVREFNVDLAKRYKDCSCERGSAGCHTAAVRGVGSWYGKPHRILRPISLSPASSLYLQFLNGFALYRSLQSLTNFSNRAAWENCEFWLRSHICRKSRFPWVQFKPTGDEERNVPHRSAREI